MFFVLGASIRFFARASRDLFFHYNLVLHFMRLDYDIDMLASRIVGTFLINFLLLFTLLVLFPCQFSFFVIFFACLI